MENHVYYAEILPVESKNFNKYVDTPITHLSILIHGFGPNEGNFVSYVARSLGGNITEIVKTGMIENESLLVTTSINTENIDSDAISFYLRPTGRNGCLQTHIMKAPQICVFLCKFTTKHRTGVAPQMPITYNETITDTPTTHEVTTSPVSTQIDSDDCSWVPTTSAMSPVATTSTAAKAEMEIGGQMDDPLEAIRLIAEISNSFLRKH